MNDERNDIHANCEEEAARLRTQLAEARAEAERLRAELYDTIKSINYDEMRREGHSHDDAEEYAQRALSEYIAAHSGEGE